MTAAPLIYDDAAVLGDCRSCGFEQEGDAAGDCSFCGGPLLFGSDPTADYSYWREQ